MAAPGHEVLLRIDQVGCTWRAEVCKVQAGLVKQQAACAVLHDNSPARIAPFMRSCLRQQRQQLAQTGEITLAQRVRELD